MSVSLLSLRLEAEAESRLGSLLRPIRPSFSTVTKEVRTLDRGLGDADGDGETNEDNVDVSSMRHEEW